MAGTSPWTPKPHGVRLTVRISPKARKDAVTGIVGLPDERAALAVSIAAPPVDGAANAALTAFLARALGVTKAAVTVASGASSRLKLIDIAGDPAVLVARLRVVSGP